MPDYRVYILDSHGRIAGPPKLIDCTDDDTAKHQALQFLNDRALEIWKRDKRVAVITPPKKRR